MAAKRKTDRQLLEEMAAQRADWLASQPITNAMAEAALRTMLDVWYFNPDGTTTPKALKRMRNAIRAALGQQDFERCPSCDGSGLATNMAGEPDICRTCMGDTVVPRTKRAEGAGWLDPFEKYGTAKKAVRK